MRRVSRVSRVRPVSAVAAGLGGVTHDCPPRRFGGTIVRGVLLRGGQRRGVARGDGRLATQSCLERMVLARSA